MKKLIPLMLLTAVVSCGKSSSKGNSLDDSLNMLKSSYYRGMVSLETTTGVTNDIQIVDDKLVVKSVPENSSLKSTLIKIDGDTHYTLEEETEDGTTRRTLNIGSTSLEEMKKAIEEGQARIKGNTVLIFSEMDYDWESEDFSSRGKVLFEGYMRLDVPCESSVTSRTLEAVMVYKGVETTPPATNSNAVSTCGTRLTDAELKALDLTNIQVCEESNDEEDTTTCTTRDMSHLTADL